MKIIRSIVFLACMVTGLFSCKHKTQPVPRYTVSKVFKTDTLTTVDVHIASRMPAGQLLLIAGKLRSDSAQLKNLAIHFLLPGNTDVNAGDNSYYAAAKFIKQGEVKSTDTLKDDNGNVMRLKQFGLDTTSAQQLLTQQPPLLLNKTVLGRFIDDYDKTVIIPFKDPTDKADEIFVIEVDASGKIVSATVPHKKVEDGLEKWLVSKNGDYITIKDSVLSQYAGNGLGLPFNSIKSGI
jgi:hypothetical protein